MISQDTTNVVNTKQLNNRFIISSGLRYDTRRSDANTKYYEALGGVLSVKDLNDEPLVDRCLNEGCEYAINLVARLTNTERTLELDFVYTGGLRLNEQLIIDEIRLALDTQIFVIQLSQPIEVNGPKRVTIPIPQPISSWQTNGKANLLEE